MSYKFMQTKVKSSFIFFAEGLELIRKTEDDKRVLRDAASWARMWAETQDVTLIETSGDKGYFTDFCTAHCYIDVLIMCLFGLSISIL